MVTSITRQSIIFKCTMQKSVLVGNYEMYYAAGLAKKCFGLDISEQLEPQELLEKTQEQLKSATPSDEKEEYLIKLLGKYEPLPEHDDQMDELFKWGQNEQEMWVVKTSYAG